MRILGFDTATSATTVALLDAAAGVELEARDDPCRGERPRHVTRLLPMVAELLDRADTDWEAIDLLAVGTGPGTFTGLRIGVATARALARARGLPLVGISTLRSLACNARGEESAFVVAVLDARRGEAFAAAWPGGSAGEGDPVVEAAAMGPETLAEGVSALGPGALAIGDGAIEFRETLERSGASVPDDASVLHQVTAVNHCRLAGALKTAGRRDVLPEYLRVPDAEIARRRKPRQ